MGVFFSNFLAFSEYLNFTSIYNVHTQFFSLFQNLLNYQPNSFNYSRLEVNTITLDPDDINQNPSQTPSGELPCCTSDISYNCNPQCPCCKDGSNPGTYCGQPCNPSTITIPTTLQPFPTTSFSTDQTTAQPCPSPPCSTNQTTTQPCLTPPCTTIKPLETTTFLKFIKKGRINGIHLQTGDQEMKRNMLNVKICSGKEKYE